MVIEGKKCCFNLQTVYSNHLLVTAFWTVLSTSLTGRQRSPNQSFSSRGTFQRKSVASYTS